MKNPLNKRLFRELKSEFGKYLVIFLFLAATIGFVSGFLVADGSMIQAYDDSFEKYSIEDGHFVLNEEATADQIDAIEEEEVTLYPQFYAEEDVDTDLDGKSDSTLRIYAERKEVNQVCLMEGAMPNKENEIAIDRMYADNNGVRVGDRIEIGGKKRSVTGLVALSDYSALFSDNGDMMFDAVKFGVAIVTKDSFETLPAQEMKYEYSWKYKEAPEGEQEEKERSDDFAKTLAKQVSLKNYVPGYLNQAIQFTGNDLGSDRSMMTTLLYILIVILAFVFAVTTSHTIGKEASVIGTLRASGYTKSELLRHYLAMPMLVALFAALVGNILGYTVFKQMAASMYYRSYSLPTYETIWNGEAFVMTTIVPMIIMLVMNTAMISRKLAFSPLQFLRHDLSRTKRARAVRLPDLKFFHRFRMRIILQNKGSYLTLFVGIVFANILLLFGLMMAPLLSHYQEEVVTYKLAEYQYVLKVPVEISNDGAEKYAVTSLDMESEEYEKAEISVYGIQEDSNYVTQKLSGKGVYISDGYAEKYRLKEGDRLTLKEPYKDKEYQFRIEGILDYPAAMAVFLPEKEFCEVFDLEEGYFNGYFSDEELQELDETAVASCITEEDLTKLSRQLDVSMGEMFYMIQAFAVILSALLIYLLTKLILEKNTTSISMVKILGYRNGEIGRLYLLATTWVVVLSITLSLVIATGVIRMIYRQMMKEFSGWLTLYIEPKIYGEMFLMGLAVYLAVTLLQFQKIKRIPMGEALKNVE